MRTVTSTAVSAEALVRGLVAVTTVPASLTAETLARCPPKNTAVSPGTKPVPLITTVVPPAVGPTIGLRASTDGPAR